MQTGTTAIKPVSTIVGEMTCSYHPNNPHYDRWFKPHHPMTTEQRQQELAKREAALQIQESLIASGFEARPIGMYITLLKDDIMRIKASL